MILSGSRKQQLVLQVYNFFGWLAIIAVALCVLVIRLNAQSLSVGQYRGATVGEKLSNAQTYGCNPALPCVLTIGPELAQYGEGTLPTQCNRCTWIDRRNDTSSEQVESVRFYGAAGDGVTDDSAAFQRAIDAARNARGTVLIPRGRYKINTALNVTAAYGLRISCAGSVDENLSNWDNTAKVNNAALILGNTGGIVFDMTGSNHITVENCAVRSAAAYTNPSTVAFYVARDNVTHSAEFFEFRRVFVYMDPLATANVGRGSIALYNVQGELMAVDHSFFDAGQPLHVSLTNDLAIPSVYATQDSSIGTATLSGYFQTTFRARVAQSSVELVNTQNQVFRDCYFARAAGTGHWAIVASGGIYANDGLRIDGGQIEVWDSVLYWAPSAALTADSMHIDTYLANTAPAQPYVNMDGSALYALTLSNSTIRVKTPPGTTPNYLIGASTAGAKVLGSTIYAGGSNGISTTNLTLGGDTVYTAGTTITVNAASHYLKCDNSSCAIN